MDWAPTERETREIIRSYCYQISEEITGYGGGLGKTPLQALIARMAMLAESLPDEDKRK